MNWTSRPFAGLETAKDLRARGAEVHLLCRFKKLSRSRWSREKVRVKTNRWCLCSWRDCLWIKVNIMTRSFYLGMLKRLNRLLPRWNNQTFDNYHIYLELDLDIYTSFFFKSKRIKLKIYTYLFPFFIITIVGTIITTRLGRAPKCGSLTSLLSLVLESAPSISFKSWPGHN